MWPSLLTSPQIIPANIDVSSGNKGRSRALPVEMLSRREQEMTEIL